MDDETRKKVQPQLDALAERMRSTLGMWKERAKPLTTFDEVMRQFEVMMKNRGLHRVTGGLEPAQWFDFQYEPHEDRDTISIVPRNIPTAMLLYGAPFTSEEVPVLLAKREHRVEYTTFVDPDGEPTKLCYTLVVDDDGLVGIRADVPSNALRVDLVV